MSLARVVGVVDGPRLHGGTSPCSLPEFPDRPSADQRRRDGESVDVDVLVEDVIGAAFVCLRTFEASQEGRD